MTNKPTESEILRLKETEYERAVKGYHILVKDALNSGKNEVWFFGCEDKRLHEERVIALNQVAFSLEKEGWSVLRKTGIPLKMKWRKNKPWNWFEKLLYGI